MKVDLSFISGKHDLYQAKILIKLAAKQIKKIEQGKCLHCTRNANIKTGLCKICSTWAS